MYVSRTIIAQSLSSDKHFVEICLPLLLRIVGFEGAKIEISTTPTKETQSYAQIAGFRVLQGYIAN